MNIGVVGSDLSCRTTTQGLFTWLSRAIFATSSTQPSNSVSVKELPFKFAGNGVTFGETFTGSGRIGMRTFGLAPPPG